MHSSAIQACFLLETCRMCVSTVAKLLLYLYQHIRRLLKVLLHFRCAIVTVVPSMTGVARSVQKLNLWCFVNCL